MNKWYEIIILNKMINLYFAIQLLFQINFNSIKIVIMFIVSFFFV